MALGRRCDIGCATWPNAPLYNVCAVCGEATTLYEKVTPLDDAEAASLKLHYEFERYYERRGPRDGEPLPDDLARIVAESRTLRERITSC